jgi:hypothetical protein
MVLQHSANYSINFKLGVWRQTDKSHAVACRVSLRSLFVEKPNNKVHSNNPYTLNELEHICETITSITVSKLKLVPINLFDRPQVYEQKGHILYIYYDGKFF